VQLVVGALVLITVGYLVMLATKPGGASLVAYISDVTTAAAATAACVACAFAGRRCASSMRAFWWVLAAALGAWACAEWVWTWYEVVLRVQVPTLSWADVGYLAAPVLAVAAFACHPATRSRDRWRVIPILDGIAVASALLFVSWTLVLGPLWSHAGGLSVGSLVAVAYPFSDVVILVLVVLALRSLRPGDRAAMMLLLGGLVCMAVSDSVYTYLTQIGRYSSGDLIDAGWFASYLTIAAAAYVSQPSVDTAGSKALPSPLMSVLAPNVPILVALVVIPVEVSRGARLDRVEWGIALCLTIVVLARQILDLFQRRTAFGPPPQPWSRPAPSGHHQAGSVSRASLPVLAPTGAPTDPAFGGPTGTRGELATLTLQLVAAARPTAQERVQRVSGSVVMMLTSVATVLALWDLSLLARHTG
jgi:diguanylate cyclase